jgi:hypothetical protein
MAAAAGGRLAESFALAFAREAGWGRDGRVGPITPGKPRGHHAEQVIASHAGSFTS